MPQKKWVYGGDSDSEYTEYDDELIKPCKMYNMRTKDAIGEKALRRHIKLGIPRRTGYYQLQTRGSSRARPTTHFYEGHHWEVGPVNVSGDSYRGQQQGGPAGRQTDEGENRLQTLEHTTRNLTIHAVNSAVDAEQTRRIRQEAREKELAAMLYSPMNSEFARLIAFNMDEDIKEERSYHNRVETDREQVFQQMLHFDHQHHVDDLMELERDRRLTMMHALTDHEQCTQDQQLLSMLKGVARAEKMIHLVQMELTAACHDLEEVSHEEDHAVDDLFLELKDDFVASFKRATLLMKFHMAEENEKRHRMADSRALCSNKKEMDQKQRTSMRYKDHTQEEMVRIFAGVIQEESQKETIMEDNTQIHKVETQEQLLHRLSVRQADKMAAQERVRRLREMEKEMRGHLDPLKEHIKDIVMGVQEEMLVDKFHGKKVMFRPSAGTRTNPQMHYEGETPRDRKLRNARLQSRRHVDVVGSHY